MNSILHARSPGHIVVSGNEFNHWDSKEPELDTRMIPTVDQNNAVSTQDLTKYSEHQVDHDTSQLDKK